jgi:hypothetical protein
VPTVDTSADVLIITIHTWAYRPTEAETEEKKLFLSAGDRFAVVRAMQNHLGSAKIQAKPCDIITDMIRRGGTAAVEAEAAATINTMAAFSYMLSSLLLLYREHGENTNSLLSREDMI